MALDLPGEARTALTRWREPVLAGEPGLRAVPAEHLHLTLCFLGDRQAGDVGAIAAALEAAVTGGEEAARPGELALDAPVWLPPRRPRVLAVDVGDPSGELAALQARLVGALVHAIGFAPEARPFRAHVSVARVRGGARVDARRRLDPVPPLGFAAAGVTLYRSVLARGGARHEPLARV